VRIDNAVPFGPASPGPNTPNDSGVLYQERLHDRLFYLPDLRDNAPGKDATNGHSYEVAGFLNARQTGGVLNPNSVRKTQSVVSGYTYQLNNTTFPQYNYYQQRGGPSDIWIIYDEDDASGDVKRRNEDYPDPGDNHGAEGANVIFCDGHAAWIKQKSYLASFFRGTDEFKNQIVP
jgi:prepilin-type processing-associated H-X9-DG protein